MATKNVKKSNVQKVRTVKAKAPTVKKATASKKKKSTTTKKPATRSAQTARKPNAVWVDSRGHIIVEY